MNRQTRAGNGRPQKDSAQCSMFALLNFAFVTIVLIGQVCFANPSIHIGKHSLSLRRPSLLRGSKSERSHSMSPESGAASFREGSTGNVSRRGNSEPVELGANTRYQQLSIDCSAEAFDRSSEIAEAKLKTGEIKSVDSYMAKHFKKCETMLARELLELHEFNKISPEEEKVFDRIRELLIESDDHTDFDSTRIDRHVPTVNLSFALLNYMGDLNKLVDPRSEKYNFKEILKTIYQDICKPILRDARFDVLVEQYDSLDKMAHLRDPTAESEENLMKWVANIRICSYKPKEDGDEDDENKTTDSTNTVADLIDSTETLLLDQLGDDRIEDPDESLEDFSSIAE